MSNIPSLKTIDSFIEAPIIASILHEQCEYRFAARLMGNAGFQYEQHQIIYSSFRDLAQQGAAINLLSVQQYLAENSQLEKAGGRGYLAALEKSIPIHGELLEDHVKLLQQRADQVSVIRHVANMLKSLER